MVETAHHTRNDKQGTGYENRRAVLRAMVCGAAATTIGTWPTFTPAIYASDAPEQTKLRFGFIALTDCSPLVIAHEKGMFKKLGIQSTPVKPANWAAVRDALVKGDVDCTHMLLGMPIASSMGLEGTKPVQLVAPWILNRNGQAISLKTAWKGKAAAEPAALKPLVEAASRGRQKATFAMTFPTGTHAMWLRYFLAAGGIHPDRDVQLLTIPPPQMVQNMKVGKMDGFCVGEPWNARAIAERVGFTAITSQEIWPDHPEKVCAFTAEYAERNPKTVKAALKALHEASVWLDDLSHRPEQCDILARDAYIKCNRDQILGRMLGNYDYGDGRKRKDDHAMIFHARNCNYPQPAYAKWWVTQLRRWGMVEGVPDYNGIATKVMRADLYTEAMNEIGYEHAGYDDSKWSMFDGVKFDPTGDCEAYAKGFAIHNLKG